MKAFFSIAIWAALSLSLSLYNKWILSHQNFNFPVSLAFLHMLGACFAFQVFSMWKKWSSNEAWPRPSAKPHWPVLALTAVLFSASISMRNSAVAELPLSFVQLLASLAPMCTYVLSVAFGFAKLMTRVLLSLSACVFGVWFGLSGSLRASWHGVVVQATGMFLQTLQVVLLQKLMRGEENKSYESATDDDRRALVEVTTSSPARKDGIKMSSTNLISPSSSKAPNPSSSTPHPSADRPSPAETLAVYAPYCAVILFFPMCALELERALLDATTRSALFGCVIAGNVAVALALNLAVTTCIRRSSAMTLSLSGLAKDWTVVAASNILFGKEITLNFIIGMTIVTFAMVFYALSAHETKARSQSLKEVVAGTSDAKERSNKA